MNFKWVGVDVLVRDNPENAFQFETVPFIGQASDLSNFLLAAKLHEVRNGPSCVRKPAGLS